MAASGAFSKMEGSEGRVVPVLLSDGTAASIADAAELCAELVPFHAALVLPLLAPVLVLVLLGAEPTLGGGPK